MRIVFMGTPAFALPSLDACTSGGHQVVLVVTQPSRPRGRGRRVTPSPVRRRAEAWGLPVLECECVNDAEHTARLRELAPEVICVTAFGQILSPAVLNVPAKGCVNVHASLLPRWRGAAPVHHAILAGDRVTGVTTQFMVEKMDAGDIILQRSTPLRPDHTQETLSAELAALGGVLLAETLTLIERGAAPRRPQDEAAVTYAPRLKKEDGRVDWTRSAEEIHNLIRGTIPWPGAFTLAGGRRLRLWGSRLAECPPEEKGIPGQVVEIRPEGIVVETGAGLLLLTEVQPENRRRMPATDWFRGIRLQPGDRLGAE